MDITVFLGAPGSGKGTQAKRLVNDGVLHFSTGDMLRSAIRDGSEVGVRAKTFMDKGDLVPDAIMIELIAQALKDLDSGSKIILDGFPRTEAQAEALETNPMTSVTRAIYFKVPNSILIERLTGRRVCKSCGQPYHVTHFPPAKDGVCDKCSGEVVQRSDDSRDVVENRLAVYETQTAPLLDYYREVDKLGEINADVNADVLQKELKGRLG